MLIIVGILILMSMINIRDFESKSDGKSCRLLLSTENMALKVTWPDILNGCHGYWHVHISSKKNLFYNLQHKITIL